MKVLIVLVAVVPTSPCSPPPAAPPAPPAAPATAPAPFAAPATAPADPNPGPAHARGSATDVVEGTTEVVYSVDDRMFHRWRMANPARKAPPTNSTSSASAFAAPSPLL